MARKLTIAVAGAMLALPPLALAASLGLLVGGSLGTGAAPVTACDTSFTVGYTTLGGNVTTVTVGDIADPACEAGDLSVTLVDSAGAAVASGGPTPVPTDGDTAAGSVAVSVSPQPTAESVAGVRIVVAGP